MTSALSALLHVSQKINMESLSSSIGIIVPLHYVVIMDVPANIIIKIIQNVDIATTLDIYN